jgi:16S rRNA (guanine1516-N2)-methyltransferase
VSRDGRLLLRHDPSHAELCVDFTSGDLRRRLRARSIKGQPLARAVGMPASRPRVLDGTAGLLCDAVLLVGLGATVTALERSRVLFQLAADGVRRAILSPEAGPVVRDRLQLVHADTRDFLRQSRHDGRFDVIYLDPMYPESAKTALPRKEIQLLRALLGPGEGDAAELLDLALLAGVPRVVVKRPLRAPPLRPGVMHRFAGKVMRFDLYLPGTRAG